MACTADRAIPPMPTSAPRASSSRTPSACAIPLPPPVQRAAPRRPARTQVQGCLDQLSGHGCAPAWRWWPTARRAGGYTPRPTRRMPSRSASRTGPWWAGPVARHLDHMLLGTDGHKRLHGALPVGHRHHADPCRRAGGPDALRHGGGGLHAGQRALELIGSYQDVRPGVRAHPLPRSLVVRPEIACALCLTRTPLLCVVYHVPNTDDWNTELYPPFQLWLRGP